MTDGFSKEVRLPIMFNPPFHAEDHAIVKVVDTPTPPNLVVDEDVIKLKQLHVELAELANGRTEDEISIHRAGVDKAYWDKRDELHLHFNKMKG